MNQFEHDHEWTETDRTQDDQGTTIQKKCDGCGLIMAIGPGKIDKFERLTIGTEDEAFQRRVIQAVVADIKANGPIRMTLLGIPDA